MRITLPPLEPPSQAELWQTAVRTAPICRKHVPLEASLSYPVPGKGALYFFHSLPSPGDHQRWRIISQITARFPDLHVTEFIAGAQSVIFPGLPLEVSVMPIQHEASEQASLYRCYPALVKQYPDGPAGAMGGQFLTALKRCVPAALMPYYHALNTDFFDWCQFDEK